MDTLRSSVVLLTSRSDSFYNLTSPVSLMKNIWGREGNWLKREHETKECSMNRRRPWVSWTQGIRKLCMALLLAFCVLLLFPASSSAHAVLVRSDPPQNALVRVPPVHVL